MLLVVAALLPVLLFSGGVILSLAQLQRSAATRRLSHSATLIAATVDRELAGSVRALQALASSEALARGDLKSFHTEARRMQATQPAWMTLILISPDGRQLVNAARPWGTRLPPVAEPASLERVLRTRAPWIGTVARGPLSRWAFPVRVPVLRGSSVRYVLTAAISPDALSDVVRHHVPNEEWSRAVMDGDGVIVARTRDPEQFVGQRVTPELLARMQEASEGLFRTRGMDGVEVYAAFARTPSYGWTAAVSAPAALVERPVWDSAVAVATVGAALLLLSGAGAYFLSRRVSRGIASAARAASDLAHGDPPRMPASSIREVVRLREALDRSASLLAERERQRDEHLAVAEAARAEAEAANGAKDQFLALLGHELRNPLSPIVIALELLKRKGQAECREWQIIERQVQHLRSMVEDLMDVSRIARGKVQLHRERLEMAGPLRRAVEAASPLIEQRSHRLTLEVPERGLEIEGDALRLMQVFTNLLTNAARYTPPGGEIHLAARRNGDRVEVTVSDNGRGIAPDLLPRLFDAFAQGPRSIDRKEGGLGLGLTLVRSFVSLHGGEIEVRSEGAGRGSRFTVRLPACTVPEALPLEAAPAP